MICWAIYQVTLTTSFCLFSPFTFKKTKMILALFSKSIMFRAAVVVSYFSVLFAWFEGLFKGFGTASMVF